MQMRDINPIGFRAKPNVSVLLKEVAHKSGRSINSQMNHYICQGLRLDGYVVPANENAPTARTVEAR